jgi:hypothetical protein
LIFTFKVYMPYRYQILLKKIKSKYIFVKLKLKQIIVVKQANNLWNKNSYNTINNSERTFVNILKTSESILYIFINYLE